MTCSRPLVTGHVSPPFDERPDVCKRLEHESGADHRLEETVADPETREVLWRDPEQERGDEKAQRDPRRTGFATDAKRRPGDLTRRHGGSIRRTRRQLDGFVAKQKQLWVITSSC